MSASQSLFVELENTFKHGTHETRAECLRRVTDLFLTGGHGLSEEQISVFDDVICYLSKAIETRALVELSKHLAPVGNAPVKVVQRLAHNDVIAVAEPMLTQSPRLATVDLIEIAATGGQGHLRAISARAELQASVTDILISRGDRDVLHTLSANKGARFSDPGLTRLVERAETDDKLAENIGVRADLPWHLLRQLVLRASRTVQSRLLSTAPAESRDEIERIISSASDEVTSELGAPRNYVKARRLIAFQKNAGQLNEASILEFARTICIEEMVAGLAALCSATIELVDDVVFSERADALLVPCKAAGFEWPTVHAILKARGTRVPVSEGELEQAKTDYAKLSQATAQRVLRYWQVRETAARMNAKMPDSPDIAATANALGGR
jgi:uncharacterized protein (DUF2336 family)